MFWHGADVLSLTSRVCPAADTSDRLRTTHYGRRTAQSAERGTIGPTFETLSAHNVVNTADRLDNLVVQHRGVQCSARSVSQRR